MTIVLVCGEITNYQGEAMSNEEISLTGELGGLSR